MNVRTESRVGSRGSLILRLLAAVCFLLACIFTAGWLTSGGTFAALMLPLGLLLWCLSTL